MLAIFLSTGLLAQEPVLVESPQPVKAEQENDQERPETLRLMVMARDKESGVGIRDIRIAVFDGEGGDFLMSAQTDGQGRAAFTLPMEGDYRIESCHPSYTSRIASITNCDPDPIQMCVEGFEFINYEDALDSLPYEHILMSEIELTRLEKGAIVDLDQIYYDYDKATLRPESESELAKLVQTLEERPSLQIGLRAHTDSRGTDEYNQDLSQRRAQSVVDYLVAEGISQDRFTARGFGESQPVNDCVDGVECSAEEHQRNRRTEFEVLEYEPAPCEELVSSR